MTYTSDGVVSSAAYAGVAGAPAISMVSVISSDAILMLPLYGDMVPSWAARECAAMPVTEEVPCTGAG